MKFFRRKTSKLPTDITVITCSNREDSIGLLIPQLKKSNIPYINIVPKDVPWDNTMKISYIVNALKDVTTKYVLILDAFDVIMSEDNSDILEVFKTFGKKLVFNASKNNFPNMEIDIIPNRDQLGSFKYLNAGCCLGETKYTLSFYDKCLDIIGIENPDKSEQLIVRNVFNREQDNVCIDHECKMFQTVAHCTATYEDGKWVVV
jgi:hypothetical protein